MFISYKYKKVEKKQKIKYTYRCKFDKISYRKRSDDYGSS